MSKADLLRSMCNIRDALNDIAANEKKHAKELDAICKGFGDRSDGIAAGLGIAAHLLERTMDELDGQEGHR